MPPLHIPTTSPREDPHEAYQAEMAAIHRENPETHATVALLHASKGVTREMLKEVEGLNEDARKLRKILAEIVDQAKKGGDNEATLEQWKASYEKAFLSSNRTRYTFDWMYNNLSNRLDDLDYYQGQGVVARSCITERWAGVLHLVIKPDFQPPNKTESQWWQVEIEARISKLSFALSKKHDDKQRKNHHEVSETFDNYIIGLNKILIQSAQGRRELSRKDWLKRDHEIRILLYLCKHLPKFEVQKDGSICSPFQLVEIKQRLGKWDPPAALVTRKLETPKEFKPVPRNAVSRAMSGLGIW